MLSQEWTEFIESGVAMVLACADRDRQPDGVRAVGAVVSPDRRSVTFYVQRDAGLRILPVLEDTKEIAVAIAQPTTYKALQLKGRFTGSREVDENERGILERYRELFLAETDAAGVPAGGHAKSGELARPRSSGRSAGVLPSNAGSTRG